jgi:hypothetical protein
VADHHTEYLAQAIAALTPEGHKKVDAYLDQLAQAAGSHDWIVRLARTLETEADSGRVGTEADEPVLNLTDEELDRLTQGFLQIRDTEHADDVADWANAVIQLITDERDRGFIG